MTRMMILAIVVFLLLSLTSTVVYSQDSLDNDLANARRECRVGELTPIDKWDNFKPFWRCTVYFEDDLKPEKFTYVVSYIQCRDWSVGDLLVAYYDKEGYPIFLTEPKQNE